LFHRFLNIATVSVGHQEYQLPWALQIGDTEKRLAAL
jgi:hypothetical protein